jgi:hypothetical protein
MRLFQLLLLLVVFSGCRSVFDPAPYNPKIDPNVLTLTSPTSDKINILHFASLKDAESKLQALSSGYEEERDTLIRQQLLFDIPLIGLAVATVASGAFHASKDSILALGIGAATMGGGRLYFSPQTRVTTYNSAAFALSCASVVARAMANVKASDEELGKETARKLSENLELAKTILTPVTDATGSPEDRANLLQARDQAQKARDDLLSALDTLSNAHTQLQSFAMVVIKGATNKVITGTQNLAAVLEVIRATPTTVPTPTGGVSAAALPSPGEVPGRPSAAQVARDLQKDADIATRIAKRINDTWSALTPCALTQ